MKIQRILGAAWLAICGYIAFGQLSSLLRVAVGPHFNLPGLLWLFLVSLVYLTGILASIFLFRGASWARVFIGFVALLTLVILIIQNIRRMPLPILSYIIEFAALVSVVFLSLPRRKAVA